MSECMLEVAEWVSCSVLLRGKNRNTPGKIAQVIHKRIPQARIKPSMWLVSLSLIADNSLPPPRFYLRGDK